MFFFISDTLCKGMLKGNQGGFVLKALLSAAVLVTGLSAFALPQGTLDNQVQTMIETSLPHLACNMNIGTPGSIIASPEHADPDYYFHWVRDSALVTDALVRLLPYVEGTESARRLHTFIADFAAFSARLQDSPTPYGLGEVRFNPDGSIDSSPWPRPQYDGPALRALALMHYARAYKTTLTPELQQLLLRVIERDLNAVEQYYNTAGYDLWEYSIGFHFFTRMVQASALHEGNQFFGERAGWRAAENELYQQLEHHWNTSWEVIAFNDGPAQDYMGNTIPTDPLRYDTSVALAVNHGQLEEPHFTLMDERVWATLTRLEDYFLTAFPVNAGKKIGPAMGRHKGDNYYGGNSFYFLTSAYSELSFRIASQVAGTAGSLIASPLRVETLSRVLDTEVAPNTAFKLPNQELAEAFAREGDAFLKTMLDGVPADGTMAEQQSKMDGSPASAHNLSWSYASVLTAILQREQWHRSTVDFKKLDFTCPTTKLVIR